MRMSFFFFFLTCFDIPNSDCFVERTTGNEVGLRVKTHTKHIMGVA